MTENLEISSELVLKGDILIIDDTPANLDLLSTMLSEQRYRVRVAISGRRALEGIKLSPPDLILLDINMPEMNGYEVCHRIKADPDSRRIPIIFLSALDETIDKVKAFQAGGIDYITKPFQLKEVLVRVENQLRISRLQRELEQKNAELEARNQELIRKNEDIIKSRNELVRTQERTEHIFAALSKLLPGTVLDGRYHLQEKLGAGGFGIVYRAQHVDLDRSVAIKIFRRVTGKITPEGLQRFRREGISCCRVNHPNAINVLDSSISSSGIAYLVMELLQGHTLSEEIKKHQGLTPLRAIEIIEPVCQALAVAHASGVVHRDIKPDNIFLHQTSEGEVVKVVDFGIAKLFGEEANSESMNITLQDRIVGTPVYMSPERLIGQSYDGKTDIYSVGVTLYKMLTGSFPYPFESAELAAVAIMHLKRDPIPLINKNQKVPVALAATIMQTISKDPAARPSATELSQALQLHAAQIKKYTLQIQQEIIAALEQPLDEETELDNLPRHRAEAED